MNRAEYFDWRHSFNTSEHSSPENENWSCQTNHTAVVDYHLYVPLENYHTLVEKTGATSQSKLPMESFLRDGDVIRLFPFTGHPIFLPVEADRMCLGGNFPNWTISRSVVAGALHQIDPNTHAYQPQTKLPISKHILDADGDNLQRELAQMKELGISFEAVDIPARMAIWTSWVKWGVLVLKTIIVRQTKHLRGRCLIKL